MAGSKRVNGTSHVLHPSVSDFFIESAIDFDINKIKRLLEENHERYLSAKVVSELYKYGSQTRTENIDEAEETNRSVGSDQKKSIEDIRKKFIGYFNQMAGSPLSCKGRECKCTSTDQTCLPAVQELFMWCLQTTYKDSMEMAVLLWNYCDDKIACACIGWAVKTEMMKEEKKEPEQKSKLERDAREFQQLAISTLKGCHDEKRNLTRSLLRKQCPWWNNLSILQIVFGTKNMEFLAQPACEQHMTYIWMGGNYKESNEEFRFQTLVDAPPKDVSCLDFHPTRAPFSYLSWPVVRYSISLVLRFVFLGVYSYVLLFCFNRSLTISFCVLIVWVADIAVSEVRQALNPDPRNNASCLEINEHCNTYWKQKWNWLDALTIGLFAVGMLVFAEDEILHIIGRTVLSIDLFFFSIRALQLLMVFKDLGLMLVMVKKMVKDTINFMFILLVFVFAFAVSSEAILYSKRELGYRHIFLILRKSYWQVFGELFLDEISFSASDNDTASSVCTDPPCPSTYGQYFVPIMLGFYIMVTNVLLLNLLIARFNKTFEEVHDQAVAYQSWYRAIIIIEYHDRPHLPPPLNILRLVYGLIESCFCTCIIVCILYKVCKRSEKVDETLIENENVKYESLIAGMKQLEKKHAKCALKEIKPRSDENQNTVALRNKILSKMEEQLHRLLLQELNPLRKSIPRRRMQKKRQLKYIKKIKC